MPISSPTALRHNGQSAMCASNSRRSTDDSDPSTYAASHIAYSSCPDRSPPYGVSGRHRGIIV